MLTREDYQKALDVQLACNLSGVVNSFQKVLERIWEEARAQKKGTDWVNNHPISRLYAEQILSLSGGGCGDPENWQQAYNDCLDKVMIPMKVVT